MAAISGKLAKWLETSTPPTSGFLIFCANVWAQYSLTGFSHIFGQGALGGIGGAKSGWDLAESKVRFIEWLNAELLDANPVTDWSKKVELWFISDAFWARLLIYDSQLQPFSSVWIAEMFVLFEDVEQCEWDDPPLEVECNESVEDRLPDDEDVNETSFFGTLGGIGGLNWAHVDWDFKAWFSSSDFIRGFGLRHESRDSIVDFWIRAPNERSEGFCLFVSIVELTAVGSRDLKVS